MTSAVDPQSLADQFWKIGKVPHDPVTTAFLNRCQSYTIKVDGKSYKYFQSGAGPTVLLVHGVHSYLGNMVPIAETLLAQGLQVALFDAPAHGEAPGTSTDPVEVSALIRALYGQVPDLRAVVAHSLGGLWALAAWTPDVPARTLVTISTPATMTFLVDKFVAMTGLSGDAVQEFVRLLETRVGADVWTRFSPEVIVRTIGVPGLILHGAGDDFVPPDQAEQLHANWGDSTLELVPDGRHFEILRSPEVHKTITAHLQDV